MVVGGLGEDQQNHLVVLFLEDDLTGLVLVQLDLEVATDHFGEVDYFLEGELSDSLVKGRSADKGQGTVGLIQGVHQSVVLVPVDLVVHQSGQVRVGHRRPALSSELQVEQEHRQFVEQLQEPCPVVETDVVLGGVEETDEDLEGVQVDLFDIVHEHHALDVDHILRPASEASQPLVHLVHEVHTLLHQELVT